MKVKQTTTSSSLRTDSPAVTTYAPKRIPGFEVTSQPATYLPPDLQVITQRQRQTTRKPVQTTKESIPTPRQSIKTTRFSCASNPDDPRCPANCYPGSTDRRCNILTTPKTIQTTPRPIQTTIFSCSAGSQDPRCKPDCYPGSPDRRCPQTITQRIIQTTPRPIQTTAFSCSPGSQDPRCKPDCFSGSTDSRCPRPFSTTSKPIITTVACYPGSPNPNCPQPYRPSSTNPPVTYLPPLDSSFVRRLRQVDQVLIEDINNLIQPGASDFHEITSSLADKKTEVIHNNQSKLRQKRETIGEKEIISITINFKGYQFA